eukprot:1121451-Pleurochrysis_carterae.AAC.8
MHACVWECCERAHMCCLMRRFGYGTTAPASNSRFGSIQRNSGAAGVRFSEEFFAQCEYSLLLAV